MICHYLLRLVFFNISCILLWNSVILTDSISPFGSMNITAIVNYMVDVDLALRGCIR